MRTFKMKQITALAIMTTALFSFDTQACGLDEVGQLQQFKAQLGAHLDASNIDTRFIINRNDKGAFKDFKNVGQVSHPSDFKKNTTDLASATILNGCYAITNYHAVEGFDFIASNRNPKPGRRVNFSFGPVSGTTKGFSNSVNATVVDPGILNLKNRQVSNDVVLIKFDKKISKNMYSNIKLDTIVGQSLNTNNSTDFQNQFFVAGGYASSEYKNYNQVELSADFCNPKAVAQNYGLLTNCVITPGMSAAPLFQFDKKSTCNEYDTKMIGISTLGANSSGKFSKASAERSTFVAFTPTMIEKIKKYTDQDLDENCN